MCFERVIEGINEGVNLVSWKCSHKQYIACAMYGPVDYTINNLLCLQKRERLDYHVFAHGFLRVYLRMQMRV